MIELEILVEVYNNYNEILDKLQNFTFKYEDRIIDTYFYDPLRDDLKPNVDNKIYKCFRIRQKSNSNKLTYKDDVYKDGIWQYSNEYETSFDNLESMETILNKLGYKKLVIIDNHRKYFEYNDYKIVVEDVKNLGVFLEVEYENNITESDIDVKRLEMQSFLDDLGLKISKELNSGKPELYLKKNGYL